MSISTSTPVWKRNVGVGTVLPAHRFDNKGTLQPFLGSYVSKGHPKLAIFSKWTRSLDMARTIGNKHDGGTDLLRLPARGSA